jgi:hypothetical protein
MDRGRNAGQLSAGEKSYEGGSCDCAALGVNERITVESHARFTDNLQGPANGCSETATWELAGLNFPDADNNQGVRP